MLVLVGAQHLEAPSLDRGAGRCGEAEVAGEDVVHALLVQHPQRFLQPVEQVGVRGVRRLAVLARSEHLRPVPEGLGQRGFLVRLESLLADRVEGDAGGSMRPFCDPDTVTSTFHSSWR